MNQQNNAMLFPFLTLAKRNPQGPWPYIYSFNILQEISFKPYRSIFNYCIN